MMIKALPTLVVMAVLTSCVNTLAEGDVETVESASHIVTGTVTTVFTQEGDENDQYVIQIRIASSERGEGYQSGDTIFTYAYQRRDDASQEESSSGHSDIPKEGHAIRARIKLANGGMEALYPYWFDLLNPCPSSVDSGDSVIGGLAVSNTARLQEPRAAIADLEQGVLKLMEYPPPPFGPGHLEYIDLLKSECGIEWETPRISTSRLTRQFREEIRQAPSQETSGYSDVMRAEIKHRSGNEIFAKLRRKAESRFETRANKPTQELSSGSVHFRKPHAKYGRVWIRQKRTPMLDGELDRVEGIQVGAPLMMMEATMIDLPRCVIVATPESACH